MKTSRTFLGTMWVVGLAVDVSRNIVKALEEAGGRPKYTEYPGVDHNSWDRAYGDAELVGWLFAQKRGAN